MDPSAPNYDRPPRRRRPNRRRAVAAVAQQVTASVGPRQPVKDPGYFRPQGSPSVRTGGEPVVRPTGPVGTGGPRREGPGLSSVGTLPPLPGASRRGSGVNLAERMEALSPIRKDAGQGYAKLKAAQFNDDGKHIGMYNATHVHGEPIKQLLALLKARRTKNRTGGRRYFGGPSDGRPSYTP